MKIKIIFDGLNFEEINVVLRYFFKYCLEQHHYMVDACCNLIKENLELISMVNRNIFIKELEDQIASYKEAKHYFFEEDKWKELLDFINENLEVSVNEGAHLKGKDLDLVFPSALRACLFYGEDGKEKMFEYFEKVKDNLPEKSIIIMEKDLRDQSAREFLINGKRISEEDQKFWIDFYLEVFPLARERNIRLWN